ncbi:GGDEF domain-containing protein [Stenotrophomonas sp. SY1]|uniref:GGDEF domain-containing protein n=1 Tax=Stenotrophomonas sp. SY1 TaxID=477235 RepID=UPI002FC30EC9
MGSGVLAVQTGIPDSSIAAGASMGCARLSAVELALLQQYGRRRVLHAGDVLFRRGDAGTSMFIIISGAIGLDFCQDMPSKQLGAHDFFGELGLLIEHHLRSSDARATEETVLQEVSHADFQRLIDLDPEMVLFFLRRTLSRVVSSEQRLVDQLSRRNQELETALGNLYNANDELHQTRELVYCDDLTGLSNRRALTLYLQKAHRAGDGPQGLLLIDCDDFKGLNDSQGHLAGDHALQSVGRVLSSVASRDDIACRLGGDEFCVLLHRADEARLARAAEFVLEAVRGLVAYPGAAPGACSVSIGLVLIEAGRPWNSIYSRADRALYGAKRRGGNRACWSRR